MMSSLDVLARAIDALGANQGPKGATPDLTVDLAKPLKNKGKSYRDHKSHSELGDHEWSLGRATAFSSGGACTPRETTPKRSSLDVVPVDPVVPSIDSKEKNRGHTNLPCGPLWPSEVGANEHAIADVPNSWIDGFAKLADMPTPAKFPAARWTKVVADTAKFLKAWAPNAHRLGWHDWELFGCHRQAPWHRIQGLGLVPLLQRDTIVALTSTEAVVRTRTGAVLTFRRKQVDPLHPAERCLIWELDHV